MSTHLSFTPFFCAARIGNGWLATYFVITDKTVSNAVRVALTLENLGSLDQL